MNKTSIREDNIELLRILCCLMVLVFHVVTCIDLNRYSLANKLIIGEILYGGGRTAVNVFVIIGAWFLCDSKFSIKRIKKLFFCNFVYQFAIGLFFVLNGQAGMIWFCKHLFSITTNQVWFISAYLVLLIITPLLNEALKYENSAPILFVLFILFCFIPTFYPRCSYQITDMAWFAVLYLFTGCLKYHRMKILDNMFVLSVLFLISWTIPVAWFMLYEQFSGHTIEILNIFGLTKNIYFARLNTIPALTAAFTLFFIFRKINIKSEKATKVINFISATTLDIYIIFSSNSPQKKLWWIDILNLHNIDSMCDVYILVISAFIVGFFVGRLRMFAQKKLSL
mgnify:FL=1